MITQILLQQTIIMFLLMMLGLLLSRRGMITEQGSRDLSNVLLYAVIPCVILRSYMSEFSMDKLRAMGISAVIAVIAFIASIGVAYLTCGTRHRIENFAVAFGNAGFIGIPLVTMEMKTGLTNTIFRLMVSFLPDIITIPYVHCSRLTSVLYETT